MAHFPPPASVARYVLRSIGLLGVGSADLKDIGRKRRLTNQSVTSQRCYGIRRGILRDTKSFIVEMRRNMDIVIKNIPENVVSALNAHAQAAGMDRMAWILQEWAKLAQQPIIKERYAYRVYGKVGKGIIRRLSNDPNGVGGGCSDFSEEEFTIYKKAQDLMRRNDPGDREKAVALLQGAFEEVMEVSV
jgi:hypothetical protein